MNIYNGSGSVDLVPLLWATPAQGSGDTHAHICPKAAENIDI